MGIWIRSQDKKILANVITAGVDVGRNIFAFINNDKAEPIVIGTYSTEEKALKVLDAIQNAILIDFIVFQMPQNDEVE